MTRTRTALKVAPKLVVLGLAVYGVAWLLQAESILQSQCEARMGIVERDSMAAERAGEWMIAAHGYAHLIAYGPLTDSGCGSSEVSGDAWQLPLWTPLLRVRYPKMDEERSPDFWALSYERSIAKAKAALKGE